MRFIDMQMYATPVADEGAPRRLLRRGRGFLLGLAAAGRKAPR